MESIDPPEYIYKIISHHQWQASEHKKTIFLDSEDEKFIHLAKEEQVERIVNKFWADEPEYVVLKLATAKLNGDLVYEVNLGGSTKFYHLYRGHIPFNAIVESKVVYKEHSFHDDGILDIVQIGDPILRQPARELSVEEILGPEIQNLIKNMQTTMRAAMGVGLAAPQIGRGVQLAVIEDDDLSHLTPEQLTEKERNIVPFQVIINPRLFIEDAEQVDFFEACLSISEFLGLVPRAKAVRVECLNEHAEPVIIKAKGWHARILQHEIDHLNATLFIDRAYPQTLTTQENYINFWKDKKPL